MSVTKRDLPEIHVRRETKYGMDPNAGGINYNNVPEEYLLSLSDDSGKLMVPWYHFERLSERLRKAPYHGPWRIVPVPKKSVPEVPGRSCWYCFGTVFGLKCKCF